MLDPGVSGGVGWDCGFGSGNYIYAAEGTKVVRIDVGTFGSTFPSVTLLDTSLLGSSYNSYNGAVCAHDQEYGYILYKSYNNYNYNYNYYPYYNGGTQYEAKMIRFALGSSGPFEASPSDPTLAPASTLLGALKTSEYSTSGFDGRPLPISTDYGYPDPDYGYIMRAAQWVSRRRIFH